MSDFCAETRIHTARKQHRCAWCRYPIPAGAVYVTLAGVSEGEWFHAHLHPECEDDTYLVFRENGEWLFGDGEEFYEEYVLGEEC